MGAGCEIALACDIRVMAEEAHIGTPEIKSGALPASGGTQRMARFVGLGKAKELIMTGEPITASEALRIGLVNSVVSGERLMGEARRYAGIFVQRAPFALATAKRLVLKSFDVDLSTGLELERRFIASMATPAERKAEQERAAAGQDTYGKIFRR
jgi:enoyl-CoA hydratase